MIVAGVSERTPAGLLRRITALESSGEQVQIATESARLTDAVWSGKAQGTYSLEVDPEFLQAHAPGVNPHMGIEALAGGGFFVTFDTTFASAVRLKGSFTIEPTFDFAMEIKDRSLEYLLLRLNTNQSAALTIETGITGKVEWPLKEWKLKPLLFWISFVPVIVNPKLTIMLHADGSVTAGVSTGFTANITTQQGLEYLHGEWQPIGSASLDGSFEWPKLTAEAEVLSGIGPRMTMVFYDDMFSVLLDGIGFARLNADVRQDPWWTLTRGLQVSAGVKSELFPNALSFDAKVIFERSWLWVRGRARARIEPLSEPLDPQESRMLSLSFTDSTGTLPLPGRKVMWSTSDASVVSVDTAGVIKGERPGKAWIRAAREDHIMPDSIQVEVKGERGLIYLSTMSSEAWAVNDLGHVVGWVNTPQGRRAFLWKPDAGMQILGTLGGTISVATAINDAGHVAGWSYTSSGQIRAFTWTPDGGMQDLGTLGGTVTRSAGINRLGHVVGTSQDDVGRERAFVWNSGQGMQDLGDLGSKSASATAINDIGQIVGQSADSAYTYRNFLVVAGSQMQGINVGPSPKDYPSFAVGINNSGYIAGYGYTVLGIRGFLRSPGGSIQDIGTLGGRQTYVAAINARGHIVGRSEDRLNMLRAYIWKPEEGMQDLGSMIPRGINGAGQVVGSHNGRAVLW